MQQDIDTLARFVSGDGHDEWHGARPAECFGRRSMIEERRFRGIRHRPELRFGTMTLSDQACHRLVVDENDARSEVSAALPRLDGESDPPGECGKSNPCTQRVRSGASYVRQRFVAIGRVRALNENRLDALSFQTRYGTYARHPPHAEAVEEERSAPACSEAHDPRCKRASMSGREHLPEGTAWRGHGMDDAELSLR